MPQAGAGSQQAKAANVFETLAAFGKQSAAEDNVIRTNAIPASPMSEAQPFCKRLKDSRKAILR